jgi:hypothetical protein
MRIRYSTAEVDGCTDTDKNVGTRRTKRRPFAPAVAAEWHLRQKVTSPLAASLDESGKSHDHRPATVRLRTEITRRQAAGRGRRRAPSSLLRPHAGASDRIFQEGSFAGLPRCPPISGSRPTDQRRHELLLLRWLSHLKIMPQTDRGFRRVEETMRAPGQVVVNDKKPCSVCKSILDVSAFGKSSSAPTGLAHACKACVKEKRGAMHVPVPRTTAILVVDGMKPCHTCKRLLPVERVPQARE